MEVICRSDPDLGLDIKILSLDIFLFIYNISEITYYSKHKIKENYWFSIPVTEKWRSEVRIKRDTVANHRTVVLFYR